MKKKFNKRILQVCRGCPSFCESHVSAILAGMWCDRDSLAYITDEEDDWNRQSLPRACDKPMELLVLTQDKSTLT